MVALGLFCFFWNRSSSGLVVEVSGADCWESTVTCRVAASQSLPLLGSNEHGLFSSKRMLHVTAAAATLIHILCRRDPVSEISCGWWENHFFFSVVESNKGSSVLAPMTCRTDHRVGDEGVEGAKLPILQADLLVEMERGWAGHHRGIS